MENNVPLRKKEIANDAVAALQLDWQYGADNTNVVVENSNLGVRFLRYAVTLPNDEIAYDIVAIRESRNNSVIVVRNSQKQLGLVWEWRPIPAQWFWACPRGFGDPEDEDNIATAKRETIEEIGNCKVVNSQKIGNLYQNTTFFENPVGLVLLDVEEVETRVSQEEGIVDFKFFTREEIMAMIREDKIEDTFTLSALMRYFALEGID
jgi:hypothetical protein